MFAKKDAHRYKNAMLQKIVPRGFTGTITRHVFLCLQMKQHEFDFSTQENGKIILFIRSGFYICRKVIFVVSVLFKKERRQSVHSYVCILYPSKATGAV